jgi:hypothetical protein
VQDAIIGESWSSTNFGAVSALGFSARYSDDGVKGADSVDQRLGYAAMLNHIAGNVVRTRGPLEKAGLVAKLKAARERKKAATGKCGGRHSVGELSPQTVALAKKLARYPLNGRRRSLRDVADELEAAGHVTSTGTRYGAAAVARMIC